MSELEFLSPDQARPGNGFEPVLASPLRRALAHAEGLGIRDSSQTAQIEVRGDVHGLDELDLPGTFVKITPGRALVICDYEQGAEARARLRERFDTVIDMTAAYAGLRIEGEQAETLMRRLTDLDLDDLPAVGAVAHVPALVRGGGEAFELLFPQEYGHYLAEVVIDAAEGLR